MMRLVSGSRRRLARRGVMAAAALCVAVRVLASTAAAADDPRVGLGAGWLDAETAESGMKLLGHPDKPPSSSIRQPGSFAFLTSDMALQGNHAFVGNFHGFKIFNISNPDQPDERDQRGLPGRAR